MESQTYQLRLSLVLSVLHTSKIDASLMQGAREASSSGTIRVVPPIWCISQTLEKLHKYEMLSLLTS